MSTLDRAIVIATEAHSGQVDKAGAPYILHPLRVMLQLSDSEEQIVGVLHDVIEDTSVTIESLRNEGFSEAVLSALQSVTRLAGETYSDFILRASKDPIGKRIKLADLADNSNLDRIGSPTAKDIQRIEKYQRAIKSLLSS